jgi:hypothetical protein
MLAMQPFSGKLRCPCVRGSRPSQSARRTGHTLSLVVRVDQRQGHPPSRPPIKIKIPALCLRRTQTQGRGTLHLKLMQAEKAKPTQVVVEPDKAAETPLGMTPWSASGQGHDQDEAAERGGGRSCSAGVGGGGLFRHECRRTNGDEKGLRQERPDSARRIRSLFLGRWPRSAAARDCAALGGTRAQEAAASCEFGEYGGGGSGSRDDTSLSSEGGADGEGALGAQWAVSGAVFGSAGPFSKSARRGAPTVISVHIKDKPGLLFPVRVAHPPCLGGFVCGIGARKLVVENDVEK